MLLTAIDLISQKGYKSVTTQEIATTAGLSEKTLFRHFGSKQNLLETAFDRFHYSEEMEDTFHKKLTGDLETDLLLISKTYHRIMNQNRKMIMIAIKEGNTLPGFLEKTQQHPRQLLKILTLYFKNMHKKGKIIHTDFELQAISFMMMNFGAFLNNLDADKSFPTVTLDKFIQTSVQTFARALTP
ncbi:TetR/AcrR family transcriptional regulator [Shimazuella sp. AN120528]|uniref:TetR/AcrR family transcriptional regulator n=1 Tax=Shimazuella soli TaxID=1892854 RepID=UPI001F115FD9|nr:TetR/AcrR family transcriptional regulator [Shimazuella soli]MCH5584715.1 TetR/AcrR family transcriptional regulator [Shimazuella soli]